MDANKIKELGIKQVFDPRQSVEYVESVLHRKLEHVASYRGLPTGPAQFDYDFVILELRGEDFDGMLRKNYPNKFDRALFKIFHSGVWSYEFYHKGTNIVVRLGDSYRRGFTHEVVESVNGRTFSEKTFEQELEKWHS